MLSGTGKVLLKLGATGNIDMCKTPGEWRAGFPNQEADYLKDNLIDFLDRKNGQLKVKNAVRLARFLSWARHVQSASFVCMSRERHLGQGLASELRGSDLWRTYLLSCVLWQASIQAAKTCWIVARWVTSRARTAGPGYFTRECRGQRCIR